MKYASVCLRALISAVSFRRWSWRVVQVLVSLLLLAWLLSRIDSRTVTVVVSFPLGILVTSLVIFTTSQIFGSLRLWVLLRRQAINFSFLHLVRLTFIGFFASNFLPSTIGGDLYKAVALARGGHGLGAIVLTLIVDRFLSLITLLVMTAAAVSFADPWLLRPLTANSYLIASIIAFAAMIMVSSKSIMHCIRSLAPNLSEKLIDGFSKIVELSSYFVNFNTLFLSFLFSFLSTSVAIFAQLLIANALGIHIGVVEIAAVTGIATLFALVPISANGIGVQEASIIALLQLLGVAEGSAIAFAIFSRALILGTSVLGGILFIFFGRPSKISHS